ncbi:ankyrin repeat-containing domain protein [Aspergillus aurantiobrunneus]
MTSYYFFEETPNHHPLCIAVENGHRDIVEFLVKYGCDISMQNPQSLSLLCLAAIHEHTDMVQTLLNLGAQQNIQHYFKDNSPIQIASYKGNQKIDQKIVEILVNHSPETNRPTRQQMQAALECALLEHHLHIVTLLLQSGVDLDFYFEHREPKSCRFLSYGQWNKARWN